MSFLFNLFTRTDTNSQSWVFGIPTLEVLIASTLSDAVYSEGLIGEIAGRRERQAYFTPTSLQVCASHSEERFAIVELESYVVLCIAGSKNLQDWMSNFKYELVPWDNNIPVHGGFRDASESIPIFSIFSCVPKGKKFIICGHSRGGAIAKLLTMKLLLNEHVPNQVRCITFGAPLVGGDAFEELAKKFDNCFTNFIMNLDPVAIILGTSSFSGTYAPSGNIYRIITTNKPFVCSALNGSTFTDLCKKQRVSSLPGSYADHLLTNYQAAITELATAEIAKLPPRNRENFTSLITPNVNLVARPAISNVEASFRGGIEVLVKGQNLHEVVNSSVEYPTSGGTAKVTSTPTSRTRNELKFTFNLALDKPITDNVITIHITNNVETTTCRDVVIFFKRILLMGRTGSGKTLLRQALRDCDLNLPSHKIPRAEVHHVPSVHTQKEKFSFGKGVNFEEWEGFIKFNDEEAKSFIASVIDPVPVTILVVFRATDTITHAEWMYALPKKITEGSDVQLLYVITDIYGLSPHLFESTIKGIKEKILQHDTTAHNRIFTVNSDPRPIWKGPTIEVEGVQELYAQMQSRIATDNKNLFEEEPKRRWIILNNVNNFFKTYGPMIGFTALSVASISGLLYLLATAYSGYVLGFGSILVAWTRQ